MTHTPTAPEGDAEATEAPQSGSLANPRRIRLGADGRPLVGPVTATSD
jgi:hypothetical protein